MTGEEPLTHEQIHRQIAEALASLVSDDPQTPPHPYISRYLAQHAARGHVLDDAHVPPQFCPGRRRPPSAACCSNRRTPPTIRTG